MTEAVTTTGYAILGQLVVRPSSTYELATSMRRNVRFFLPRVESQIYDQAKRLERLGLARSDRSFLGRRPRTTYAITAKGRLALRAWLGNVAQDSFVESEVVLRTFVAASGTLDDLLRAIDALTAQAEAMQAAKETPADEAGAKEAATPASSTESHSSEADASDSGASPQ